MDKRTIVLIAAASLAGQAYAFPVEAVTTFFSKLFRGTAKEASLAGRATDGAVASKGLSHLPVGDTAKAAPVLQVLEPKPNMVSEPIAKSRKDADAYKVLRASANSGDTEAMLRMSDMTSSGKVSDPGEPWRGYWMFQAARLGSQEASRRVRAECANGEKRRETDRWFDTACGTSDGRNLYTADTLQNAYSPRHSEFSSASSIQPTGTK